MQWRIWKNLIWMLPLYWPVTLKEFNKKYEVYFLAKMEVEAITRTGRTWGQSNFDLWSQNSNQFIFVVVTCTESGRNSLKAPLRYHIHWSGMTWRHYSSGWGCRQRHKKKFFKVFQKMWITEVRQHTVIIVHKKYSANWSSSIWDWLLYFVNINK